MSDPYIGEIRLVPYTFAPMGWLFCDGQVLPVAQYQALFAVIGNIYGGDGQNNFALPDFRGRVPIHWGIGVNLTPRTLPEQGGAKTVVLAAPPAHTHLAMGATGTGPTSPANATWGTMAGRSAPPTYFNGITDTAMNPNLLGPVGNGAPHNNMQPYLALNFVIAVEGIFPTRS